MIHLNENFERELADLINRYCVENDSNTPDFILAGVARRAIEAFSAATVNRDDWYSDEGCTYDKNSDHVPNKKRLHEPG